MCFERTWLDCSVGVWGCGDAPFVLAVTYGGFHVQRSVFKFRSSSSRNSRRGSVLAVFGYRGVVIALKHVGRRRLLNVFGYGGVTIAHLTTYAAVDCWL